MSESGPREEGGGLHSFYVSLFALTASANDFHLAFGSMRHTTDKKGDVSLSEKVWDGSLVMSVQSAKQLRDLLLRNIEAFEKQFGKVPYPPLAEMPVAKSVKSKKSSPKKKK